MCSIGSRVMNLFELWHHSAGKWKISSNHPNDYHFVPQDFIKTHWIMKWTKTWWNRSDSSESWALVLIRRSADIYPGKEGRQVPKICKAGWAWRGLSRGCFEKGQRVVLSWQQWCSWLLGGDLDLVRLFASFSNSYDVDLSCISEPTC